MKLRPTAIAALSLLAGMIALPAIGQHQGHQAPAGSAPQAQQPEGNHAGQAMPMPSDAVRPATPGSQQPAAAPQADAHAGHGNMPMSEGKAEDLPVGEASAPAPIPLGAADSVFGASAMNAARSILADEHGGELLWKLMTDQAEYRVGPDGAAYGWDAEAWFGGGIHRLVGKSEGEGGARGGLGAGEGQALYSRAVAPYTDLQFGLRQDIDSPAATYAVFGAETILPYWFKVEGALFLSNHGDAFARLEGTYDLMITQRLVLQPNLELNFAMQDVPAKLVGSGFSDLTAGLRLRYDLTRQFSPYIGVNFERKLGVLWACTAPLAKG